MWFFIISILGILICVQPTVKYWVTVTHEKTFTQKDFFGCSIFQAFFSLSVCYYVYWLFSLDKLHYTIIPILALGHLVIFMALSIVITISVLIDILLTRFFRFVGKKSNKQISTLKRSMIVIHTLQFLISFYAIDNFKVITLSGKFLKKCAFVVYVISGIIVCSPIANSLISDEAKKGVPNSVITMLQSEANLYSNIFVVGTIPLAFGIFFEKSKSKN